MDNSILIPSFDFLRRLNLDLTADELKAKYPYPKYHYYLPVINHLTDNSFPHITKNIDRLKSYLQAFEHLIAIPDWERALGILIEPIGEHSHIEDQDILGQLQVWSYYRDTIELCEKIVDKIEPRYRLLLLGRLANAYENLHEYQQAIELYQHALDLATELGQLRIGAQSISNIGNIHLLQRDYQQAIASYHKAGEIAERIDDDRLRLTILGNNGNIFISIGDYVNAIPWLEKALVIARKIGDRYAEGITVGALGIATSCLGQHQQAEAYLLTALAINRDFSDRQGELSVLANLGNNCDYRQDYKRAIEYHQQALQLARELKDRLTEVNALSGLGNSYYFLNDYQQSQIYFELSKELAERIDYPLGLAIALANIGTNLGKLERTELAISCLLDAFDRLKQLQAVDLAAKAAYEIAEIYYRTDRLELALIYLDFAIDIAIKFSLPLSIDCENLALAIAAKKLVNDRHKETL